MRRVTISLDRRTEQQIKTDAERAGMTVSGFIRWLHARFRQRH